jgi:phosphoglycerol transferase MdoB-like AlkP superfamily enzyme
MHVINILKTLFFYFLVILAIFTIGRIGLFITYFDRIVESGTDYWLIFVYGLKMDVMATSFVMVIPTLIVLGFPHFFKTVQKTLLQYYLLLFTVTFIFLENATFQFIAEFDVRPNEIFINYLEYPKEVFGNIWATYKFELFLSSVIMASFAWWFINDTNKRLDGLFNVSWFKRIIWLLPILLLLFIGIRSSFGHRPANLSDASFSNNHLVNEITKNTPYTLGYTVYAQKKYGADMRVYGKMPLSEAIARTKRVLDIESNDTKIPFLRFEKSNFPRKKPKNLVLFIQESLGAQFVGATGGEEGITPHLNRLAKEGILFTNAYSNGTRSIRGLSGVVAGFLPVPGQGVIKRNKAQKDFFTIAQLLKPKGYATSFIYGGERRFDNMGRWFYGNGFDTIIDEPMYDNPKFHGIWGVSDEDLVLRAHQEFQSLHDQGKPFVSVMFSSSNHTPFEFPENTIELVPNVPKHSVKNAIKYADHAIGEFIKMAKASTYYDDTVFVIVADHNVRTYGDDLIPVNMYHIPALILGGGIAPEVISKITTQPDILATAIDLIGMDATIPVLGRSVFSSQKQTALLQFHDMYALMQGERVSILQPNKTGVTFDVVNRHLKPTEHDWQMEEDLRAILVTISHLYEERLHTLQK